MPGTEGVTPPRKVAGRRSCVRPLTRRLRPPERRGDRVVIALQLRRCQPRRIDDEIAATECPDKDSIVCESDTRDRKWAAGLIPFLSTAEALTQGVGSVVANRSLLTNTVFPIDLAPVKAVVLAQVPMTVGMSMILAGKVTNVTAFGAFVDRSASNVFDMPSFEPTFGRLTYVREGPKHKVRAVAGDYREAMDIMFHGPVIMNAAALPGMLELGQGRIVNVGSIGGEAGLPRMSAYSSAKAALHAYSRGLAIELAPLGVAVTTITGSEAHRARTEAPAGVDVLDHVAPGDDDRALDDVFQFPNIAGIIVFEEGIDRFLRKMHLARGFPLIFFEEILYERRDVLPPLPERRDSDGDHVQPEIEVLPETPGLHLFLQVVPVFMQFPVQPFRLRDGGRESSDKVVVFEPELE